MDQSLKSISCSYKYLIQIIYMHVGLSALIIMNLSIIARFTQLKHPFFIKWTYINSLAFKAEYFDTHTIKYMFIFILIYNIGCFSIFGHQLVLMSILWFISVWWWDFFASGKFYLAFIVSFLNLIGYTYLSNESLIFVPNTIYFIYILYLSTMYALEGQN